MLRRFRVNCSIVENQNGVRLWRTSQYLIHCYKVIIFTILLQIDRGGVACVLYIVFVMLFSFVGICSTIGEQQAKAYPARAGVATSSSTSLLLLLVTFLSSGYKTSFEVCLWKFPSQGIFISSSADQSHSMSGNGNIRSLQ